MFRRAGRVDTVAASDDIARRIDELEKALGEGPCLDAIDDDEPDQHICSDLTDGSKWPRLGRADHGRDQRAWDGRLPAATGRQEGRRAQRLQ